MAALRRDLCNLQAGRPPAYNDDPSRNLCLCQYPLIELALTTGAGIVDAANRLFLTDLENASVIAGDTYAHKINTTGPKFVWRLRGGYELARHPDEIGLAGTQHILAALRRSNPAERNQGKPTCTFQPSVQLPEFGGGPGRRRDLDPVAREGTCVGVEVVHQSAGLQGFRHPQPILEVITKGRELVQADANANGKCLSGLFLDRLEDLK